MDPLEERFARLTPEQQKEVMDFVDFLLLKNPSGQPPTGNLPPLIMVNPPPVMAPDPVLSPRDSGIPTVEMPPAGRAVPPVISSDLPPPLIQEVCPAGDEWITHDYMDYGKYEKEPSPATEAVKKVRQKIIVRQENEKPVHLLDWVD